MNLSTVPPMIEDRLGDEPAVFRQNGGQIAGGGSLGESGEVAQVDEHDRRVAPAEAESIAAFLQFRHDQRREEPREIATPLVRFERLVARPVVIPRKQVGGKGCEAEAHRQPEVLTEEGRKQRHDVSGPVSHRREGQHGHPGNEDDPGKSENEAAVELEARVDEQDETDHEAGRGQVMVLGSRSEDIGVKDRRDEQPVQNDEQRLEPEAAGEKQCGRDRNDADDEIGDDDDVVRVSGSLASTEQEVCNQDREGDEPQCARADFLCEVPGCVKRIRHVLPDQG